MAGIVPSQEFNEQLVRVVKQVLRQEHGSRSGQRQPRRMDPQRHHGVLVTAMAEAAESLTSPATATVRLLEFDEPTGDLQTTETLVTITNRYEGLALAVGTLVKIEFLDGEWSLYGADCVDSSISASATP